MDNPASDPSPIAERLPPAVIVLFGLSGAGKSTAAKHLEQFGMGRRVKRLTTRPARADDDPAEIQSLPAITAAEGDVQLSGWGSEIYLIPRAHVQQIRHAGQRPIVEVGEFGAAKRVSEAFAPAILVLVERSCSTEHLVALLRQRAMSEAQIDERLQWRLSDSEELNTHRAEAHLILSNDTSIDALAGTLKRLFRDPSR